MRRKHPPPNKTSEELKPSDEVYKLNCQLEIQQKITTLQRIHVQLS